MEGLTAIKIAQIPSELSLFDLKVKLNKEIKRQEMIAKKQPVDDDDSSEYEDGVNKLNVLRKVVNDPHLLLYSMPFKFTIKQNLRLLNPNVK